MAVDSTPLLKRRMSILAKIETTTGTAIALADTDGAFIAYAASNAFAPDIPIEEREAQAGFGTLPSIHGTRMARLQFETDVAGKGASGLPDWMNTLLVACGFTASGSNFNAAYSASQPTITLGWYVDGIKFVMSGCAGSVAFPLRAGFPCRARWDFMGVYGADTDVALVTPTAVTVKPPRFAGDAVLFGATTPRVSSLEIAVNNTLTPREDPASTAGVRSIVLADRRIAITADPEMNLVATRDYFTLITGHTEEAFSAAIGVTANNIITFSSPNAKLQWTAAAPGDRGKMMTRQVVGQINSDDLRIAAS